MAKRKIWAGPADGANCKPLIVEGLIVDNFAAGELLVQSASGLATTALASTVLGQECLIAHEIGASIGGTIDTLATVGDTGQAIAVRSGEFVNVRSAVANYTSKGIALTSNGNGQFKIAGASDDKILYIDEIINVTVAGTLVSARKA
tara:strand:- start:1364 stop:1804 length:441 start_codon:yes stop_codon:yes gene_type:complete